MVFYCFGVSLLCIPKPFIGEHIVNSYIWEVLCQVDWNKTYCIRHKIVQFQIQLLTDLCTSE